MRKSAYSSPSRLMRLVTGVYSLFIPKDFVSKHYKSSEMQLKSKFIPFINP
jgi:hypothetical protein